MTRGRTRSIAAVAAFLAVVAGAPIEAAAKKKAFVAGTVDGEAMKWKGRYVLMSYAPAGGVFIVATKRARPGKILPTIGVGCAVDLTTATFPVTMAFGCSANYTETRVGGSFETHGWISLGEALTVTFDSFDGTRLTGSASGVLEPVYGGDAPITIDVTFGGKAVLDDH